MAVYPNGRFMSAVRGRHFGPAPGLNVELRGRGDRLNRFIAFPKTQSTPDGYGMRAVVPPYKAGGMAGGGTVTTLAMTGNVLQGGPMEGTAAVFDLTGGGNVSLIVGLEGTAAVATLTGNGMVLKLTVGMSGTGTWSLTGTPNLAMIVPFEGSGSIASLTGTSDLRGLLSMVGEWTPFTDLSPEGLAAAVWNSVLAEYAVNGTAGKALASAGSGGVDLEALAQAILAAAQVTPIHADVKKMNSANVIGSGIEADKWRGV